MQLQQLYYFKEVADQGSINKAADALMMTQPNLSRAIHKLESELGLKFFLRDNKGVQLTDEGKQLYQYVCGILDRLDIIKGMARQEGPRVLTVSAFPTLTSTSLLQALYERYRDQQNVHFTLREARIAEIIDDVHQLRSELGVIHINQVQHNQVRSLLDYHQLEFHPISTDTWYAYLGPHSPFYGQDEVNIRDLLEYPVLRAPDDYFAILTSHMVIDGVSLLNGTKRVMFLNNEGAIINLLRTTDAFTFGMSWNREFYRELGIACKPITNCNVEITLGWIKRKKERLSAEAERFVLQLQRNYTAFDPSE